MNYQLLTASNPLEFVEAVNKLCDQGWKPCGGVSVCNWVESTDCGTRTYSEYAQAMTREDEPDPAP